MKYSPDENGFFDGQRGYGYISIEKFIDAAREVNAGNFKAEDYDKKGLPTIKNTFVPSASCFSLPSYLTWSSFLYAWVFFSRSFAKAADKLASSLLWLRLL
jgi:hypothetical protein